MKRLTLTLLLTLSIVGCRHKPQQVVVQVPIAVKAVPPPELFEPIKPELPVFISPSDPEASSALTAEGERSLRGLLNDLINRIQAWEVWASPED